MARARKKKISVKELKALLEGMDILQGEGWTPDATQWKKIREKIDQLEETTPKQLAVEQPVQQAQNQLPPQQPVQATTTLDIPTEPMQPHSMAPRIDMSSSLLASEGGQVKTPDIDTSGGGYTPQFE